MNTMQDRKVAQLRYRLYVAGNLEAAGAHCKAMIALASLYSTDIALSRTAVQLRDSAKLNEPIVWDRFPMTIEG